ncbi:MAG TPA: carboxypeptidase-like regulatory domain-containing protein [Solirubrobacterales bacterium]|nr:carboxypeptidase-like regulatory domain-containing protein [Solirubrobacterales bacterium]
MVDAEEGEGLNGVKVCAEAVPPRPVEPPCVETEEGRYEIPGLEVGGYRVYFEALNPELGYLPQYFLHTMLKSAARVVEVQQEGEVRSGIGAALEKGGWVTGTVTDLNGFGLSEVEVCVSAKLLPELEPLCAETGLAGKYEIEHLPPGPYTAYFAGPESSDIFPQYYSGAATAEEADDFFVFGYNETAGIDAEMELGSTIAGRVLEAGSNAPLSGVRVCALQSGSGAEVGCALSGGDGTYSISRLYAGTYVVGFSVTGEEGGLPVASLEDGFVRQYFEDKPTFAAADRIDATQPGIYGEVDAHLVRGPEVFPRPGGSSGPGPAPVASAPPLVAPKPKSLHCRKHFRAKKVKGKRRCVRVHKRHGRHRGSARH